MVDEKPAYGVVSVRSIYARNKEFAFFFCGVFLLNLRSTNA
jgi:hypothetical protein